MEQELGDLAARLSLLLGNMQLHSLIFYLFPPQILYLIKCQLLIISAFSADTRGEKYMETRGRISQVKEEIHQGNSPLHVYFSDLESIVPILLLRRMRE